MTLPPVRLRPVTPDEGVTPSTHFRAGTWHDSVLYAVVRGDW